MGTLCAKKEEKKEKEKTGTDLVLCMCIKLVVERKSKLRETVLHKYHICLLVDPVRHLTILQKLVNPLKRSILM